MPQSCRGHLWGEGQRVLQKPDTEQGQRMSIEWCRGGQGQAPLVSAWAAHTGHEEGPPSPSC